MRKWLKATIFIVVVCVIIGAVFFYFRVPGRSLWGISDMSAECTVTLRNYNHDDLSTYDEYILDETQIEMVKLLIIDTTFRRITSSYIYYNSIDKYYYEIIVEYNNSQQDLLRIETFGNKNESYLTLHHVNSTAEQFDDLKLRITTNDWKSAMDEIIALSN